MDFEILVFLDDVQYNIECLYNIHHDYYECISPIYQDMDAFGGRTGYAKFTTDELYERLRFIDDKFGRCVHRSDGGPAIVDLSAHTAEWRVNGKLHREGGLPAIETPTWCSWWENGVFIKSTLNNKMFFADDVD